LSSSSAVRRERWLAAIAVVALVTFRSALFVFETPLAFDSDQAVIGLMAKHLMQGRAFPLFFYGQNYMLGVEAWLAAPMFVLFGVSVAALKLPLLLMNVAVPVLLVLLLEREVGLRPLYGAIACLFLVVPPPGTAALLLETTGGNIEPFLYGLLLWLLRRRPVGFGLVLGLGFLQREFTIYSLAAILVLHVATGEWKHRDNWRPLLAGARIAVEVWLVVQVLRPFTSPSGPGTTLADVIQMPANNLVNVAGRLCFDWRQLAAGVRRFVTVHWAQLFGTQPASGYAMGIESASTQGLAGSGGVLGIAALVVLWRVLITLRAGTDWLRRYRFCLYLILTGGFSAVVFVAGRCGIVSHLRYDLLSLAAATGLAAWFLAVERNRWFRGFGVAVIVGWAALSLVAHARIWREYVPRPPLSAKTLIIRHLEARGIEYALSDYWIAYYITFVTDERIIVAPYDFSRIAEYNRLVDEHRAERIRISRTPCEGTRVMDGVYFCEP
jgi:hypothetical protein